MGGFVFLIANEVEHHFVCLLAVVILKEVTKPFANLSSQLSDFFFLISKIFNEPSLGYFL